jgi:hypothetical protein
MTYSDSIEALQKLLVPPIYQSDKCEKRIHDLVGDSANTCRITRMSSDIRYMENGVEFVFIEVSCGNAVQYAIHAYGKEARELYKEALKRISEEKVIEAK